jgi:hypothetical protein
MRTVKVAQELLRHFTVSKRRIVKLPVKWDGLKSNVCNKNFQPVKVEKQATHHTPPARKAGVCIATLQLYKSPVGG